MKHKRLFFLPLFFILLSIVACVSSSNGNIPPSAAKGVLDLRGWNFDLDGPVMLHGEWDFYWKQLVTQDALAFPSVMASDSIHVPGFWNNQHIKDNRLDADGYGTYHLRVLLNEQFAKLGIKTYDMYTAFRLYVDGQLVLSNGVVGTSRETMQPQALPGIAMFSPAATGVLDIVVQVSNFFTSSSGIRSEIRLGTANQIQRLRENNIAFECMFFGVILIMGIYHLVLFLYRRKDPSVLYFGVFCLLFAVNTTVHGERILVLAFPSLSWRMMYDIISACALASVFIFALYFRSLFPRETPRLLVRLLAIVCGVLAVFSLAAPTRLAMKVLRADLIFIMLISALFLLLLTVSLIRKRQGAGIFILGSLPFALSVVHDVLHYLGIYLGFYILFPAGLAIFILCQSYMLAVRYAGAYQAEERLSNDLVQTRNYLNSVFNSIPSILVCVDMNGRVSQWNTAAEDYTGIREQEAMGRFVWDVLPLIGRYYHILEEVMYSHEGIELTRQFMPGPEKTSVNLSFAPLKSGNEYGVVIRVEDVSELEFKEQQLRQAQKMETVGTLAGGLAHDFNNVLGGIVGMVSLMKYSLQQGKFSPDALRARINAIEKSTSRATDLVKQLLTLSRKQELTLKPMDLNQALEQVVRICENTFDKSVAIKVEYFPHAAVSVVDAAQIEQVVLNLCINALHAMTTMRPQYAPQGGMLDLAIERFQADRHFCARHPEAREEGYWIIRVRDTGVGMDMRTISKIFDPFFSTKEKGSGLGLAMVYNIVRQHGGFQDVFSEPHVGSTFNMYLPIHEQGGQEDVHEEQFELYPLDSGLVLVVDDEDSIREMARDMLEEGGYTVLTAVDGIEGVRLYQKHQRHIRMVLLDMAMPQMSGLEAFTEMKKINPHASIVLCSGFNQDPRVREVLAMGAKGFLPKPYTMVELLGQVRGLDDF